MGTQKNPMNETVLLNTQNLCLKVWVRIYSQFYAYSIDATCLDPESYVRGGPTLTLFFLVDEGREDQNTTISGPSLARQQNAI